MSSQYVIDEDHFKDFSVAIQKELIRRTKLQLINDIKTTLNICKISELDPLEYITELKEMIDSIYQDFKNK